MENNESYFPFFNKNFVTYVNKGVKIDTQNFT